MGKRSIHLERLVRTLGLLLLLGLAGFAGGCGPGTQGPADPEAEEIIRKEHAQAHRQLKADRKTQADAERIQGATRRGAHRGQAGP
jgi:hypothetical protein